MHDLNRVTLVGRLTRDCELRALPSGTSVCNLRIACNSRHRDASSGDYNERAAFFDVSVYGPPAETVSAHMSRGSRVGIDGRLSWREWETDGQKRQAVSIIADTVQFLDRPGDRDGGAEEPLIDGELVGAGVGADEQDISF
jgi:single-strand DNA-binding protein